MSQSQHVYRLPVVVWVLATALFPLSVAEAQITAPGTEYVTFWSGELRIFAQKDDTEVELIDIDTNALLSPADSRVQAFPMPANPFVLAHAGSMVRGLGGTGSPEDEIRVLIRTRDADTDGDPLEDKPVTVWTGYRPSHPNSWGSYIPAMFTSEQTFGREIGRDFLGFTQRELIFVAPTVEGVTTAIIFSDLDSGRTEAMTLDASLPVCPAPRTRFPPISAPATPCYLVDDPEVQVVYFIFGGSDIPVSVTSNVDISVLTGFKLFVAASSPTTIEFNNTDWSATPPSFGAGDDGIELGTKFFAFVRSSLAIFPTEDLTTVTITDLSDGDDSKTFTLVTARVGEPTYDIYTPYLEARAAGSEVVPRVSDPQVVFTTNSENPVDNDVLKIESNKPILVYQGPVGSNVGEFADVGFSVATGPQARVAYVYAQNFGLSNDLQLFAYHRDTQVDITSLSYTEGINVQGHHDFTIDFDVPVGTAPIVTATPSDAQFVALPTLGDIQHFGSGAWAGELLRITSNRPITVINGDYDFANFGAYVPFVPPDRFLPPNAVLADPREACSGQPIQLDAGGSFDQDDEGSLPGIARYDWDFGDGASLANGGPAVSHVYSSEGLFEVTVTVTDDDAAPNTQTDTDVVSITVLPADTPGCDAPPSALCQDPTRFTDFGVCSAAASVDAGSFDPEGGAIALSQNPPEPYAPDTTAVALIATDGAGLSESCDATVTVLDPEPPAIDCNAPVLADGSAPTLSFTATVSDNCQPPAGVTVQVTSAECFDDDVDDDALPDDLDQCPDSDMSDVLVIADCDTGVINLLLGEGSPDLGCTFSDLIIACGEDARNHGEFVSCVAHLTNDWRNQGLITGREKGVIQRCAAQAPIPPGHPGGGGGIRGGTGAVKSGGACQVDVDGATLTFPETPNSGLLSWTVNAIDDSGNVAAQTCTVVVQDPDSPLSNLPPVAGAGSDRRAVAGGVVTFDGTSSADLGGGSLTYQWSLASVPAGSAAALSDPSASQPSFTADRPGDYLAELVVNDGHEESAPTTVTVSVLNSQPVAAAGADQQVFANDTVVLDGSGSSDPDGDAVSFAWSLAVRPDGSGSTLSDPTVLSPTFVPDALGVYVVQLAVDDGQMPSPLDAVLIRVVNAPPVADAGPDQSISVFDLVQLDGSASVDADGDPLSFSWSFISLPAGSVAALSNATAANPSFTADLAGVYELELTVHDGHEASLPDTVSIVTVNTPPVADAGEDQVGVLGDTLELDGSASSDVDGDPLTYLWTLVLGPPGSVATLSDPTAVNPTLTPDLRGAYEAQLTVHDGQRSSRQHDSVTLTVLNRQPVAVAGPDQNAFVTDTVILDGSGSSDPDGDPLSFEWSFASRPAGSGAVLTDDAAVSPSFEVDRAGTYVLELVVNDGFVDSAADTVVIDVPNRPPVADAGVDQFVSVTDQVILDGSASSDPDGDPLTYDWSLVTVPAGSAAAFSDPAAVDPDFVADVAGTYVVELVVNDGFVDSAPDTVVIETVNTPPVADAGPDRTTFVGATVALDGSGSSDVDGDPLSFSWSFVAVPAGSAAALSDPTAVAPSFVADLEGDYVVELVVDDGEFSSDPDTVTISTVNAPPVADAGPDQTVLVTDTVQLDGSGSSDADGDPLEYLWSFASVPAGSGAVLSDATAVDPTFFVDLAGDYVLELLVFDGDLISDPDTVIVSTANSAPVADAGPDQSVEAGDTVFLDGDASFDVDGDPLTFTWSLTVVPAGSTATLTDADTPVPFFTADLEGTYVAQLIVNDGEVDSDPDTVRVDAGPAMVLVPDVVGLEQSVAEAAIADAGLSVGAVTTTSHVTVPADHVVTQAPAANTSVLLGAPVVLVISTGPIPNEAPEITSDPPPPAIEGQTFFYPVLSTDPEGNSLIWSLVQAPAGMRISANGLIVFTPPAGSAGNTFVTVRVEDASGGFDEQTFELLIGEGTVAPSIESTPPLSATPGTLYSYQPTVIDPDDLTFAWAGVGPPGLTVDAATGQVLWDVPADASGSFAVSLTVTDPTGRMDSQDFSIGIGGDGLEPTVSITIPTTEPLEKFEVIGTVTDPALAGFTLEACRPRRSDNCTVLTRGLAPVTDGVLGSFDPKLVADGSWEIRLTATDADGNVVTEFVDVEIHTLGGKIGALRLAFPEFTVRTSTTQLTLTRVYDGLDRSLGELGNGWRYDWSVGRMDLPEPMHTGWARVNVGDFFVEYAVVPVRPHTMTFTLEDGRFFEFDCGIDSPSSLAQPNECTPSCTELTNHGATLTVLHGPLSPYGTFLCLAPTNISGTLTDVSRDFIEYEPSHYRLETPFGEQLTFSEESGKVEILRERDLTIDLRNSTSVRMEGQELIRFNRSGDLITSAENVLSGDAVTYQHDGAGNLIQAVTIVGDVQTFEYAPGSRMTHYETQGLEPERWEYDDEGRVIRHFTSEGAVIDTQYDDNARRVVKSDLAGREMITEYDERGRITSVIDALGNETTYGYTGDRQQETSMTNPLGQTTEYEYDSRNRRTLIRNAEGDETHFVYSDFDDRVLVYTDGEGRIWEETIDSLGRVTGRILPDGTVAKTFTYAGDTRIDTDILGASTTRFDERGRMIEKIDGSGRVETVIYDDVARTVTYHKPDGTVSVGTLDALSRFTKLDFGDLGSFTYEYPPGSNTLQSSTIRPDGVVQEIQRDPLGRITKFTVGDAVVRETTYDAFGDIASVRAGDDSVSYSYDANGRVSSVTRTAGRLELTYDAVGNVTELMADSGEVARYEYDSADRPIVLEDGDGRRIEVAYDRSDRITQVTDPLGRQAELTYDTNGRLETLTYFSGQALQWSHLGTDSADNEALAFSMIDDDGVTWGYEYDSDRNLKRVTDPYGGITEYEYTTGGRKTEVVDALDRTTVLVYEEAGLVSKTSPEGRTESWDYGEFGRVRHWHRADDSTVTYAQAGETLVTTLPSGEAHVITRDLEFDITTSSGTPAGTVTEMSDAQGRPILLMLEDDAKVEMEYTVVGNIKRVIATSPAGTVFETTYTYDSGGRIETLVDTGGGRTTYFYDDGGRLIRIDRPNGVASTLFYSNFDRPEVIEHSRAGTILQRLEFDYDSYGRVSRYVSPDGTFDYEYDALSRLRLVREAGVGDTTYVYDAVGNLQQKVLPGGDVATCDYDNDDRLLSCVTPEGVEVYTYNDRGALSQKSGPAGVTLYEYDDLDRLVRAITPEGGEIRYQYDVKGRLVGRDDGNGLRRCLPLPTTPRGFEDCALSYYVNGPEEPVGYSFGPQGIRSTHGNLGVAYYLGDLLDSITGVTGTEGSLIAESSYDVWGRPSAIPPDMFFGYGYTGERQDPMTGLVYLRQRWYDPSIGRFLTPDKVSAEARDPRSLHRYAYTLNNPTNNTDPSGGTNLSEFNVVSAMNSVLQNIARIATTCVTKDIRGTAFTGIAEWALRAPAQQLYRGIIENTVHTPLMELDFHQELKDLLCKPTKTYTRAMLGWMADRWLVSSNAETGAFEFHVFVQNCGKRPNKKPRGCGRRLRQSNGIDILLYGNIPVEVKGAGGRTKKGEGTDADEEQLRKFCRFAAVEGTYVTLYIYWKLPNETFNMNFTEECWWCWNKDGCTRKDNWAGSIYGAVGITKGSNEGHVYVPTSTGFCKGGPRK